jgi:hypothetical protein
MPLPPQPALRDGSVSARQPLSCFCSGGPSGSSFTRTLLRRCLFSTIPFRIRTYEKRACKPRRIRTSETRHLKSFRIRTYKKTPGGWGGGPRPLFRPLRPRTPLRGPTSNSTDPALCVRFFSGSTFDCRFQPSAVSIDLAGHSLCVTWRWTATPITGTLLVTRRVSPRARPPSPAVRMGSH